MPRWFVTVPVDATITVVVEAEDEKQALAKADLIAYAPSLCHQCARDININDAQPDLEDTDLVSRAPDNEPLTED